MFLSRRADFGAGVPLSDAPSSRRIRPYMDLYMYWKLSPPGDQVKLNGLLQRGMLVRIGRHAA